jgi:hypothetical protein
MLPTVIITFLAVTNPSITETVRLHRLCWFGLVQRMEGNRIPKRVLYMNLKSTRPRNKWQVEVRGGWRRVAGKSI